MVKEVKPIEYSRSLLNIPAIIMVYMLMIAACVSGGCYLGAWVFGEGWGSLATAVILIGSGVIIGCYIRTCSYRS